MARTGAPEQRNTVQKEAVRRALSSARGFISAQHLHQQLDKDGASVGLATVYRRLNALVEEGAADTINGPDGQLYRACASGEHHHHLVCENCGKAVELDFPDESWIRAAARDHGFTVSRHMLEVFGRCADCAH